MQLTLTVQDVHQTLAADANGNPVPVESVVLAASGDGSQGGPAPAPGPWQVQVQLTGFRPLQTMAGNQVTFELGVSG